MKTFKEFQQVILEKSPGDFVGGRQYSPSSWQGNFLSKGKPTSVAKPNTLRMLTTNPGLNSYLQSRARSALTPKMPNNAAVTIGLGLGQVLAKGATALAGQRRQAQQQRLNQLVPSGNQPYGTGRPAQIKPLNK